ncbi:hypothetical protein L195_g025641, partial [Trifolium pratense]
MASMAVATTKSTQHPVKPSPSSVDCNDSSNSSLKFFGNAKLQSPDVLKSEEYRQLFRLPQDE